MYPLEHQIQKALRLAEKEADAFVGVFCNRQRAQHIVEALLSTGQFRGVMKWQTNTYISGSGSVVRFISNSEEQIQQACAGFQFSHVFVRDVHKCELKSYINSRLRSAASFAEPMGYYDEFGVMRYEKY